MALSNVVRSKADPRVLKSGPSSLGPGARLARGLGWLGIGLGLTQLLAPRRVTGALGMEGMEAGVRAFGVREIASGILTLSVDKKLGLWTRIAGDALDVATLVPGLDQRNRKRDNVKVALATVLGVTVLDVIAAQSVSAEQRRKRGSARDYRDRTGFPSGIENAKSRARRTRAGDATDLERTVFGEALGTGHRR